MKSKQLTEGPGQGKTTAVQVQLPAWANEMLEKYQRLNEAKGGRYAAKPGIIISFLARYEKQFLAYIQEEANALAQQQIMGKPGKVPPAAVFELHQIVEAAEDIHGDGYFIEQGTQGTVVFCFLEQHVYDVEFTSPKEQFPLTITVLPSQIQPV